MTSELPLAHPSGLRLITWNVNSILTVKHYHPWNAPQMQSQGFRGVLDALDAHIICLQETKLARDRFSAGSSATTNIRELRQLALMDGHYDSYFSFSRLPGSKKAYSGVVTYIRRRDCPCLPVAAYDGLSRCFSTGDSAADDEILELFSRQELDEMDREGRCVITDHGVFILFNVYCPNETGPNRLPFKLRYCQAVEFRVKQFLRHGRQVIVAGDLNVCRSAMDHCDPVRYCKEFNLKSFDAHPAHKWLNKLVDKDTGDAVDLFRYFHPDAKSMYTCWNTLINARPSNYGTRIDYVICTRKLTDCFSDCVLLTDVFGSDHCPVLATMHPDWLSRIDSIASSITAADDSSSSYQPPALCSSNQRDLSGPSKTIKDFFKPIAKPASVVPSKTTSAKPSVVDPHETDKYQQKSAADNPKRKIPDEFLTEQQLQARRFWQSSKLLAGKNGDNIGSNFIPPPPCCHHKEPAKLLTVNKSGPNKGRKFFMCARPVGAASSVIDVASGDTDESNHRVAAVINEFRCDFFQWKDKK